MRINSFNPNIQNTKQKNGSPSFRQLNPEHLFIKTYGYKKDVKWAKHLINVIEEAKVKISQNEHFQNVIDFIAKGYGEYFKSPKGVFGVYREGDRRQVTAIDRECRYAHYRDGLIDLAAKKGSDVFSNKRFNSLFKQYTTVITSSDSGEVIPLNRIMCVPNLMTRDIKLYIESPHPIVTPKVFAEIEKVYGKIVENKEELTSENIKGLTKDIATVHWLMSQARPYRRGSAGIADAVAKSLFEAKGIQVSPYKKNIDPNIDAFVYPLDKYKELFEGFFEKPLIPISDVQLQEERKVSWFKKIFSGGKS